MFYLALIAAITSPLIYGEPGLSRSQGTVRCVINDLSFWATTGQCQEAAQIVVADRKYQWSRQGQSGVEACVAWLKAHYPHDQVPESSKYKLCNVVLFLRRSEK